MFLVFQRTKATPYASHPVMTDRQLNYFRSLKIHHVLIFLAGSSSVPTMVEASASPLTHTWPFNDREGGRERVSPTANSAYYYRLLILACYHSRPPASFPHNSAKVLGCYISLSQHKEVIKKPKKKHHTSLWPNTLIFADTLFRMLPSR